MTFFFSPSYTNTHEQMNTHTHTLTLSHSLTHTNIPTYSQTHTHAYPHTHTYNHPHFKSIPNLLFSHHLLVGFSFIYQASWNLDHSVTSLEKIIILFCLHSHLFNRNLGFVRNVGKCIYNRWVRNEGNGRISKQEMGSRIRKIKSSASSTIMSFRIPTNRTRPPRKACFQGAVKNR